MLTIKEYISVKSLDEAYELNQVKSNVILGGTGWLKLQSRNINKAIDLSLLGLDKIEETEDSFIIGCMTSLRDIEIHKGLNSLSFGAIKLSLKDIVGVQFRNSVTIGGSIYGRYGFSDILTCLLALDTYVELYKGGIISLEEFSKMPYDRDILVRIIIKKSKRRVNYSAFRVSSTDFPLITCGVAHEEGKNPYVVLGARSGKGVIIRDDENILTSITDENIEKFTEYVVSKTKFEGNNKGSKEYRQKLAKVYIKRGLKSLGKED